MQTELTVRNGVAAYTIRIDSAYDDHPIWFVKETGEGMSMSEKNLFDILDTAFKAEF